jgi:3-methyladenine DNA glycosylase/8-oxoguanine DNA glycosylase
MMELAESWRPWRGAAAHLLWHYYRHSADQAAARS